MRLRVVFSLLLAPVAVAAAVGAGLATAGSTPRRQASAPTHRVPAPRDKTTKPSITVSPSTGLVGGERVHVALSGFPADTFVGVWECPSSSDVGRSGCMGKSIELPTDKAGSAAGEFVAQPTSQAAWNTPLEVCTTQCVVAAVESLKSVRPMSAEPPAATASVSFEPNATGGLADSSLEDLSWVSPEDGFALAAQPCTEGTCAVVAKTTDGGDHWQELPPTPARTQSSPGCDERLHTTACVNGIAFASATVGYLFGPAMFVTTDGGMSWQALPGEEVTQVAVSDGQVFRVVYTQIGCPGACTTSLEAAPVGSTAWRTVIGHVDFADIPRYQLLTSGSDVYLVAYGHIAGGAGTAQANLYRSLDGGATFQTLTDPCVGRFPTLHVLTTLAPAPGGVLQGVCTQRDQSGGQYLLTSTDSGTTWGPARLIAGEGLQGIAAQSATTIGLTSEGAGTTAPKTEELLMSTDGGSTWRPVATDTPGRQTFSTGFVPWLGFATSGVGWWLADAHHLWTTLDGGGHWKELPFA